MAKTYSGGIAFKRNPADTDKSAAFCPDRILLTLSKGADCLLKEGDEVKKYSMIASESASSPALFCGVGGRIERIYRISGRTAVSILADQDESQEPPLPEPGKKLSEMTSAELEALLMSRGVPAIKRGKRDPRCLIVDCGASPFNSSRLHVCRAYPERVIGGAKIIMKLLGARSCKFAVSRSDLQAAQSIQSLIPSRSGMLRVILVKDKLPACIPHLTVAAVCNLEINCAKDVFDAGYPVVSPLTCLACYNALVEGIPFCEGFLSVTDEENFTDILSLPFGTELDKTVFIPEGHTLVRAESLYGKNAASSVMTAATEAVKVIPEKEKTVTPSPCIGCRRCISVCPARLIPIDIYRAVKAEKTNLSLDLYAAGCFECRSCSHVCPSYIPLAQTIIKLRRESGLVSVEIPDGDPDFYEDEEPDAPTHGDDASEAPADNDKTADACDEKENHNSETTDACGENESPDDDATDVWAEYEKEESGNDK